MADYRPLVLSGTAAESIITELPTSSILITDGVRVGASALSVSGSVSATTVSSVAYTGKTYDASTSVTTPRVISIGAIPAGAASITATTVSSLTVSADTKLITPLVSATVFSGLAINGMPYPAPFVYVETDTAGTNSTDEQDFATGADTTVVSGNSNHITWNDAEKYFTVSAAGTYDLLANLVVDSGSQADQIRITSKKNGSDVMEQAPNLYGNVGPEERTFHNVLTAVAGDYITVTIHMDSTKTCHLEIGSNLTITRIK